MNETPDNGPRYPIRVVSRLTGIGIDTLRAWERRYGAVQPTRDDRGRLYSEADVERLRLLQQAVSAGHSVGRIAGLSDDELRRLTEGPAAAAPKARAQAGLDTAAFAAALARLDNAAIDHELSRLAAVLPPLALVRDVLLPTLRAVGDDWHRHGHIAREHVISASMRNLLGSFLRLYARTEASACLLFATPSGERHEIGVLGAAMVAASRGLRVCYVGADLPGAEIVHAAGAAGARVLVLGLTQTTHDTVVARELRTIVRDLPAPIALWAGGAGTASYAGLLAARAVPLATLDDYVEQLAGLS